MRTRTTSEKLNSAIRIWLKSIDNAADLVVVKRLRDNMRILQKERDIEKETEDTAT